MKHYKSLVRVGFCVAAFAGSIVLSGCAGGHSHGAGSGHSHGHGSHSHTSDSHGSSNSDSHGSHSGGHGAHSGAAHHGISTSLFNLNNKVGYIELKLHDDKGDLELWLTGLSNNTPFDIPLDSEIKVKFLDIGSREVSLKVRNKANNEDEDGKGNIRNGKTNYFIFPGDSGESANFLVGKAFSSNVLVSFVADGKLLRTAAFVLKPHTH